MIFDVSFRRDITTSKDDLFPSLFDITQEVIDNAEKLDRVHGDGYSVKVATTKCNWPPDVSGAADDWAKKMGATFAFTFELPPSHGGKYRQYTRFAPPPHFMLPWMSSWLRAVEVSYTLVATGATFDEMLEGIVVADGADKLGLEVGFLGLLVIWL